VTKRRTSVISRSIDVSVSSRCWWLAMSSVTCLRKLASWARSCAASMPGSIMMEKKTAFSSFTAAQASTTPL